MSLESCTADSVADDSLCVVLDAEGISVPIEATVEEGGEAGGDLREFAAALASVTIWFVVVYGDLRMSADAVGFQADTCLLRFNLRLLRLFCVLLTN